VITRRTTSVAVLLLTICLPGRAVTVVSTLDTNSTPGDFYGTLYLSFNATNDYSPFTPSHQGLWSSAGITTNYTAGGAQITLNFSIFSENPNGVTFLTSFTFSDPYIGNPNFVNNPGYSSGSFTPSNSTTQTLSYTSGNVSLFGAGQSTPVLGTIDFTYSLPTSFDGAIGTSAGTWSLIYHASPIPEPSTSGLLALAFGGGALWFARRSRQE